MILIINYILILFFPFFFTVCTVMQIRDSRRQIARTYPTLPDSLGHISRCNLPLDTMPRFAFRVFPRDPEAESVECNECGVERRSARCDALRLMHLAPDFCTLDRERRILFNEHRVSSWLFPLAQFSSSSTPFFFFFFCIFVSSLVYSSSSWELLVFTQPYCKNFHRSFVKKILET